MKIYLVRHGEAVPPEINPEKPLSPQGREEVIKIAKFLGTKSFPLSKIIHSQKLRAKQTAEIFGEHIAPNLSLEEHPNLNPNDSIQEALMLIEAENHDLMIVGHLPFLNKLAANLVTRNENIALINFQAGTTACLESINGLWQLNWIIGKDQI